ncbi:MAG: hypothetical protein M3421_06340 [Bacteroidota bacterium]|nr:hypothetical protein [Bacteroidota bacterium]
MGQNDSLVYITKAKEREITRKLVERDLLKIETIDQKEIIDSLIYELRKRDIILANEKQIRDGMRVRLQNIDGNKAKLEKDLMIARKMTANYLIAYEKELKKVKKFQKARRLKDDFYKFERGGWMATTGWLVVIGVLNGFFIK